MYKTSEGDSPLRSDPLVSVVMPCYNSEAYLEQAIESILGQSLQDLELIVVDDNSTDDSVRLIEQFVGRTVRLIRHPANMGISRSLNDGIRASCADFIARMDSDDISDRHRLEEQVEVMLSDPRIAVLGTGVNVVDQDGNFIYCHINPTEDSTIRESFGSTFPIWSGSQMWRMSKLREAGLFDERVPVCEDLELTLRLCLVGKTGNVRRPLYTYRKNTSGAFNLSQKSQIQMVTLARRVFILKNRNAWRDLDRLYDRASAHYRRTRSVKDDQSPARNRLHYYISLALTSLVYGKRSDAMAYLKKARGSNPNLSDRLLLWALRFIPLPTLGMLFRLNRLAKKYFFILSAGDVLAYIRSQDIARPI
jgi:glycosyltransferase involved in cell wall biosynthesis